MKEEANGPELRIGTAKAPRRVATGIVGVGECLHSNVFPVSPPLSQEASLSRLMPHLIWYIQTILTIYGN